MNKNENLRNEIDLEIPYVVDGRRGLKKVHIMFVSQGIYREYTALMRDNLEVIELHNKLETLTQNISSSIVDRVDVVKGEDGILKTIHKSLSAVKEEVATLKEEYNAITARLNDISDHASEKKFALIKKILIKNGIDDPDLRSFEWWDECTESSSDMKFIHDVCCKDDDLLNNKKKLPNQVKSSI